MDTGTMNIHWTDEFVCLLVTMIIEGKNKYERLKLVNSPASISVSCHEPSIQLHRFVQCLYSRNRV